jgi:hypothetical protein
VAKDKSIQLLDSMVHFRMKFNPDGTFLKPKCLIVVRGDQQESGTAGETYAACPHRSSLRLLVALAAARGLALTSVDISGALLQESLAELVYVKFATRLWQGAPTDTIVRLCRSLYGLSQAPRCFQLGLVKFLEESGYVATVSDSCVFTKRL